MKKILAIFSILFSLNIFAFERTSELDLTNLYGGLNAGAYEYSFELKSKTTPSEGTIEHYYRRDDNDMRCYASLKFEVGTLNTKLVNKKTGATQTFTKTLYAVISKDDYTEVCTQTAEDFLGQQISHVSLASDMTFKLPAKENLQAYIHPFLGYLTVEPTVTLQNGKLTIGPAALFEEGTLLMRNLQNAQISYYVFTQSEGVHSSLGNGTLKF